MENVKLRDSTFNIWSKGVHELSQLCKLVEDKIWYFIRYWYIHTSIIRPWANARPPSPTLGILWDQFFLKPMTLIYQTCESAKTIPLIKRMAAIFQNGHRKV